MMRRLLVDVGPLRTSPAFRRLWLGSTFSAVGSQMTVFAVALQVYVITGSPTAVGAVGLAGALPGIAFGLFAGSVVDAVDRRRLVLATSAFGCVLSAVLAAQAFAGWHRLWLLYAVAALGSLGGALGAPARRTFMPRLLSPEQVPAGAALTMLSMHASLVAGPSLAGIIAAAAGLKVCYLVDALTTIASLYGVFRLPAMRPDGAGSRPGAAAVLEGLRFLRRTPAVAGALLADLNATVLAMPVALFPAINAERFGGSPRTLGLLTTALGVGGLLGSALSGPVGRLRRQGRGMLAAGAVWGLALAGFGLVDGLAASLALLTLASMADVSSVVLRTTIVQVSTPDAYRGRIGAAEYVVGGICPELGNFRAGALASLTGPGTSALAGGLACVAGVGVIALAFPALVGYRVRPPAAEPVPAPA
jgi:MFS family permease